jgi:TRAP-type C4-dicarboxylate transport system permease small subunit
VGEFLARVVLALNRAGLVLAGAAMVFMALGITFEVVSRHFFNAPTKWAFEGGEIALTVSVFLAAGFILERERHVRMDLLTGRLREKVRNVLFLAVYPLGLVFSLLLFSTGVSGVKWSLDLGARTFIMGIPIAIPQAMVPIGGFLLSITFIYRWFQLLAAVRGRGGTATSEPGRH